MQLISLEILELMMLCCISILIYATQSFIIEIGEKMEYYKRYVKVITEIDKNGNKMPLSLIWENGDCFNIQHCVKMGNKASLVGGCGILYKCMIKGQVRDLYYEIDRWFIESKKP